MQPGLVARAAVHAPRVCGARAAAEVGAAAALAVRGEVLVLPV